MPRAQKVEQVVITILGGRSRGEYRETAPVNIDYLLSACYVPGTVLSTLHTLIPFLFPVGLRDTGYRLIVSCLLLSALSLFMIECEFQSLSHNISSQL